jgi:hypothetical protein
MPEMESWRLSVGARAICPSGQGREAELFLNDRLHGRNASFGTVGTPDCSNSRHLPFKAGFKHWHTAPCELAASPPCLVEFGIRFHARKAGLRSPHSLLDSIRVR